MSHDTYKPTPEQIEAALDFAIKHRCVINPDGWKSYLEGFNRHGHCPCDKERMECPCKQAPHEIKSKARCLCGLYWASYEAYSIAKLLKGAAVGIRVQPDKEEVEKQPNETGEPKTKHEKIEALFDLGKMDQSTSRTIDERFAEVIMSLQSLREKMPRLDPEASSDNYTPAGPIVTDEDVEIALLHVLSLTGDFTYQTDDLVQRAMSFFPQIQTDEQQNRTMSDCSPCWGDVFNIHVQVLISKDDVESIGYRNQYLAITESGLRRLENFSRTSSG